jgi:poly(hydroxyalkanoate) granule-associated protein
MNTKRTMNEDRNLQQDLRDSAHKVWLAGLGALSTVEAEGTRLFQQLVEKGRTLESEGRDQMKKARERVETEVDKASGQFKERMGGAVDDFGDTLEAKLTEVLHRFGVPTRDEIRDLSRRVEELNSKVDRLKGPSTAKRPAADRKVFHVAPHEEGWKVEAEGATRAASVHTTKEEALAAGRELAKGHLPSQVVVHKKDGTIQTEYTYDEDVVTN